MRNFSGEAHRSRFLNNVQIFCFDLKWHKVLVDFEAKAKFEKSGKKSGKNPEKPEKSGKISKNRKKLKEFIP